MRIIECMEGRAPKELDRLDQRTEGSMLWVDFVRGEHAEWPTVVEKLAGQPLLHQHIIDGNNATHPSHYDGTSDYDMVVFQGLDPELRHEQIETRTAAFFLFDHLLVTVRAPDNVSFGTAAQRLLDRSVARIPATSVGMAHFVLDLMVDRYLAIREPLAPVLLDRCDLVLAGVLDDVVVPERSRLGADQHLALAQPGVEFVQGGEVEVVERERHRLAVGPDSGERHIARFVRRERVVPRGNGEACRHAFNVVLERARKRLVEVVQVEQQIPLRRSEDSKV